MASESKEMRILGLFLGESPLRHWHFDEIKKKGRVSRAVANKWLSKYVKEGLLERVKEKGRHPYYTCGEENPIYQSKKRIFGLNMLYESGFMARLTMLDSAKTIILFGSMAKGDWYVGSDVDIFIYGSKDGLDKQHFEKKLKRSIELQVFKDQEELRKVKSGLLHNIANGFVIKGDIRDVIL